ncbi:MAG: D-glycero-beta-D-manno-heptose 1-phosphate adenylyltransferase [Azospirillaceae bacterium]
MSQPSHTLADDRAFLEGLSKPVRVAVIGDVMLDRFSYGAVERISPEAPIPVLHVERETAMPGAAGNVAANLHALGAEIDLMALIGDDAAGRDLVRLLGRIVDGLTPVVEIGRRTTVKTRFVAQGQQLLRVDDERLDPPGAGAAESLSRELDAAIAAADAVVLSDYGKGVLSPAVIERALAGARARGIPVVVDPKGRDFGRYRGASVITPNQKELAEATGQPTLSDAESAAAARTILERAGIGAIVATRGPRGMTVLERAEAEPVFLDAYPVEVFDVSGAGDTVVATLTLALGGGADLVTAARLANLGGSLVVAKPGTAVLTRRDLLAAFARLEIKAPADKVLDIDALDAKVRAWRQAGLSVGFTNGCFDLLHPGHVGLLAQARSACDRLVLGLNSDDSVRRLKGPDRPIQDERSRAVVLAALAAVDAVTVFTEDTPLALIERIRPDVLVKGADYAKADVVGAREVESWGGAVVLAPLTDGHSTSALVDRSRGS